VVLAQTLALALAVLPAFSSLKFRPSVEHGD
jgi:hypothetical protein